MMKAAVVTKLGEPEVLVMREVPEPEPREGEVKIRVTAAGINFADILARMGLYPGMPKPPFVPGLELSGTIEKVGPGVAATPAAGRASRIGERVLAMTKFGAYAEWVVVPASRAIPIPPGMSFEDAAAFPVNYLTAYHSMFQMGNLQPGERVLIHGAAGGVGVAAIQLAKIAQAEICGTASAAKFEFLRGLGVTHLVDYTKQDFETEIGKMTYGEGVDLVLDPVGGKSFAKSYRLLRPGGRLVIYGFSTAARGKTRNLARTTVEFFRTKRYHPLSLMRENKAIIGIHLGLMEKRGQLLAAELQTLFRYYSEGRIRPHIGKTFPLAEAAAAHRFIQDRQNIGKVLLDCTL
jgi:NADPH:quinone reductase-like Zn-dependent oxidoreductase